jgi:hypothetical protein
MLTKTRRRVSLFRSSLGRCRGMKVKLVTLAAIRVCSGSGCRNGAPTIKTKWHIASVVARASTRVERGPDRSVQPSACLEQAHFLGVSCHVGAEAN